MKFLPLHVYVAILVFVLICCRLVVYHIFPIFDDAFITYRYSRNLAEGYGLVYNIGEKVLGTTTPGYALVVSLLYLLQLPMPVVAVLLNILLDGALLWLTAVLFARAGEQFQRLFVTTFAACWIISPAAARIAVGGMETNMFLLLVVASAACLYHSRLFWLSIPLAVLCCFVRPEGLLFLPIATIVSFRQNTKTAGVAFAASIVVASILLFIMFSYYGSLIPQSIRAKSTLTGDRSLLDILSFFLKDRLLILKVPLGAIAVPLAIWGLARIKQVPVAAQLLLLWVFLYALAYVIVRPAMWDWYRLPVLYGVYVLSSFGFTHLAGRLGSATKLVGFLAICSALFWAVIGVRLLFKPPTEAKRIMHSIAEYCETHDLSRSTILAGDIGMIGYYSRAYIIDIHGLVWPEHYRFPQWSDVVRAYWPDYLFLVANRENVSQLVETGIASRYKPLVRFSEQGEQDVTLDPALYEQGWRPDYILLKRIQDDTDDNRAKRPSGNSGIGQGSQGIVKHETREKSK